MSEPAYVPPLGWVVVHPPPPPRGDGPFLDRRAGQEDARIQRCTCGAWTYDDQPCPRCGETTRAARPVPVRRPLPDPPGVARARLAVLNQALTEATGAVHRMPPPRPEEPA